jgi:hypothetical protein
MKHPKKAQSIDRKALQLCSQIRWALEYEINETLEGQEAVTVSDVLPAPNTSNLLVMLETLEPVTWEQAALIEHKMHLRAAALRSIVSQCIQRRKTPSLTFRVRPRLEPPGGKQIEPI